MMTSILVGSFSLVVASFIFKVILVLFLAFLTARVLLAVVYLFANGIHVKPIYLILSLNN